MSEDESRKSANEEAETEAHGRAGMTEEVGDEAEGDDVEAHLRRDSDDGRSAGRAV